MNRIFRLALLTASLDPMGLVQAAPGGAQITAGTGTVSQTGNTSSQIFGHLDANGQVWLIIPMASCLVWAPRSTSTD